MSRVVVVGAGLGGLAVAARLARLRHEVVVLEAADVVGGALGAVSRDGFSWDTGPTVLTLPAALRDLFLKTGQPLETVLDLDPLHPLVRCVFADGTSVELPNTGLNEAARAFDIALGQGSGDAWRRLHAHAAEVWTSARGALVESSVPTRRELLRRPRLARTLAPRRTLRELGERLLPDPRQRAFLDHYALAVGSDPRRAPSYLCTRPYVEQTFRAWTVTGGMRRLVEAVHERAAQRGVDVRTGQRVVAVTTDAGRVAGVRLADGQVLSADVVVSDVDARELYDDLLPSEASRAAPAGASRSASMFTVMLGLRGDRRDLPTRTVLFPADGERELDALFGEEARPAGDPTMSVHVSRDAAQAPGGDEAWTIAVAAPRHGTSRGEVDWTTDGVAAGYARQLVDCLASRGLDVRDRVVVTEHRSPADIERVTGSPGGAAYGTATHGPRAAWLRAANRSPVPGLFLVGGSAHPGPGIPSVTMSAAIVAELVGRG